MVNTTFFDTSNTILDLFTGANNSTGGVLGIFMLGMTFLMVMLIYRDQELKRVLLYNSFLHTIVTLMLVLLDFLEFYFIMPFAFLIFVGIVLNIKD